MNTRCFFTGHREAPESLYQSLYNAVLRHAEDHSVDEFIVGKYGNFDAMAAKAVIQVKNLYPSIRLTLLCPYHPAVREYVLEDGFDEAFYPFSKPVPMRFAIVRANLKAIDISDYLIAYAFHPGKARDFLEYAQKREKRGCIRTENLWEAIEGKVSL
ncbi:MAG: hypothetical protein IKM02_05610 [Clostridia bacterium]|nr:hypothetical protein [Clostridia bacterium]